MTNEQVITRIKHNSMYKDDRETADYIIKALERQPCDDCVSRKAVIDMAKSYNTDGYDSYTPLVVDVEDIEDLPPVTPTHGTCKDCKRYNRNEMFCTYHGGYLMQKCDPDYYCWDFEKRGNENGIRTDLLSSN